MILKTSRTLVSACGCLHDANVAQKLKKWCYFWGPLPLATVFGSTSISTATVLNVTPRAEHFAKNKPVYAFRVPTIACLWLLWCSWRLLEHWLVPAGCIHDANVAQNLKNECYFWGLLPLATVFGSKRHFQGYSSQCDTYGWTFCQKEARVRLCNAKQWLPVNFMMSLKTSRKLINACTCIHEANVTQKLKKFVLFWDP